MVSLDLHQSAHVVHKICHGDITFCVIACTRHNPSKLGFCPRFCNGGFCPYHSDSSEYQPLHALLHESEHMLHPAPRGRLQSIVGLLFLGQRMSPISFLAHDRHNASLPKTLLRTYVSRIRPRQLAHICAASQQLVSNFGVMHIGRCHLVVPLKLSLLAYHHMVLISVFRLPALLRPSGIHVLVALLVRFVIPQFVAMPLFYLLVLFPCVPLARSNDKACINDLSLVDNQA